MTSPHIELLWFEGCPNHHATERLVRERLRALGSDAAIQRVEVPDDETGVRLRFAGSPTVRIDGVDIEPGWKWSGDGTPRCRLYATSQGLRGVPEAGWIDRALGRVAGLPETAEGSADLEVGAQAGAPPCARGSIAQTGARDVLACAER